ncbi:hypothetical protein [Polyangium mundeleinium]|uniref:Uncharacterized protein n=1 Tax=Polyangium mundeleinium TaxID=2995306 RepID=A0ABT5EMI4_9BACT|nr:hypothetical protein [Polyangium mundeleinium]MDC0743040.1 hypothetical protein [Polyangium mundeleinium]
MSKRTVLSTLIGVSIVVPCATAFADVVLEPNVIKGQARFSNTNPSVVALLQQLGMSSAQVSAGNSSPSGYTSNTNALVGTPLSRSFELSAESGAGGPGGVTYTMGATGFLYAAAWYPASGQYWFQPVPGVVLQPLAQQPAGTTADIVDCIGLVHVRWGLDPQCNTPFTIGSGSILTSFSASNFMNTSEHYILQRGDASESKPLSITTGNDPTQNTITFSVQLDLHPKCDDIQEICIDMSAYLDGGGALGSLKGPFDVLGEVEEDKTFINAFNGPSGNQRYGYFSPPEMPVAAPATWWTLPNMVPGDYEGYAQGLVRTGRLATHLTTPRMGPSRPAGPMTVQSGVISDLQQNIGGQLRYPFVMEPARFVGKIYLADPFVVANVGAYSSLSALRFSADPPYSSQYPWGTTLRALDIDTYTGQSTTSFEGSFDPASGALASVYDQLVVNTYDIPTRWIQSGLMLDFDDLAAERQGFITMQRDSTDHLLGPGDVAPIDHMYCFNEVELPYSIASGLLFDPYAKVMGGFNGTDWIGSSTSYSVQGTFYGWPKTEPNAATNGMVRLALPQGTYTIQPGSSVKSASGAISTATFAATKLDLGCGQRVTVSPGLSVSAELPLCAASATPDVVGAVASSGVPVDRIWYTVNGGPEIDICASNCGADPQFSAALSLAACGNTIQVFASAGGQTASVTTQTTWEDPNDGVDCEGSCEPPPPSGEACASVDVKPLACEGGGGGYSLTLEIKNELDEPMTYVLLPDPHVSPNVVTLPVPLQPGASTKVTVTVSGVNPGAGVCLNLGMSNPSQNECCSKEICFDVPACCFAVAGQKISCIPGAPGGTFEGSFNFENRTLDTIEHVFLFPPSGVTVSPQYVDVPSTPPGGLAHVGGLSFSGATPGEELCLTVGIHDEEMNECCTDEVCFQVPEPCDKKVPGDPLSPTKNLTAAESCSVGAAGGERGSVVGLLLGLVALGGLARRRRA